MWLWQWDITVKNMHGLYYALNMLFITGSNGNFVKNQTGCISLKMYIEFHNDIIIWLLSQAKFH